MLEPGVPSPLADVGAGIDLVIVRENLEGLFASYGGGSIVGDDTRAALLDQLLGSYGTGCGLRAPFYVDYGYNIHLGRGVFFNYGCVVLDVCPVRIGAGTEIGPYVQILTADHPRDAETRATGQELGQPITIGANVWIGGGARILAVSFRLNSPRRSLNS